MGALTLSNKYQDNRYIGISNQTGNTYQPHMVVEQRIMPYHDENIKNYQTLKENPYNNMQYYGYK